MFILDSIIQKAQQDKKTIVLAEGDDPRVIEAAVRAQADGLAECILIGSEELIHKTAEKAEFDLEGIGLINPALSEQHSRYSNILWEKRKAKGVTLEQAELQISDPLGFADMMLACQEADGSIAGARYTTGARVRSALQIVGVAPDFNLVSSFFLMLFEGEHHNPKRALIFADCGLVIDPDCEQLCDIAVAAAQSAKKLLGQDPKIAFLSFSTEGSASHESVDRVKAATLLARKRLPDAAIDGEVQLDAAIIPAVAAKKISDSNINGDANILIFPNLNAGNIGYKIAQRFGGATAIGPILQGLKYPANDLSRGCSADDVYHTIALTAVQAQD